MHCDRRCGRRVDAFVPVAWLCAAAVLLGGCASPPPRLIDGVGWVADRHHVTDAKVQRVEQWPCLRVDAESLRHLSVAMTSDDLPAAKQAARRFLDGAHRAAIDSTNSELDRLDEAGWKRLASVYLTTELPPDDELRGMIRQSFTDQTDMQHRVLVKQVEAAETVQAVRAAMKPIQDRITPSIKEYGRVARALPVAIFSGVSALAVTILHQKEHRGETDRPFELAIRHAPAEFASTAAAQGEGDEASRRAAELLQRYAPIIVQQRVDDPPYDPSIDLFGRVAAERVDAVRIDTSQPVVYAYSRTVWIHGEARTQLVYTHWYPAHPAIKGAMDPEAGAVEGVTLRITLDRDDRPLLYETVLNCGCYHRVYPTQRLEQAAAEQYGEPEGGKRLAIERSLPGRIDMVVPKVVADGHTGARPIIRCSAGGHLIIDVSHDDDAHRDESVMEQAYALRPYDELERLPLPGGGVTSMFADNGLVHGAGRLEGVFFTPIGILSAGQPRQRGTQLIHWDQWDFDDAELFDKTLRMPKGF